MVLSLLPLAGWAEESAPEEAPKEVVRPTIGGWHSWRYNSFSSYDQLRINLEQEYGNKQKALVSINGLYYQEDDNKSWSAYLGEAYYKFAWRNYYFALGQLVETLGSGDKISWVDKLNSRRYHNGLANDYNRDKKEQPAVKASYKINDRMSLDLHYLPVFQASDMTSIYSKWATQFQQFLAKQIFFGALLDREKDTSFNGQAHIAFNSTFKRYELRYHYFHFKERVPMIELVREGRYRWVYPLDQTWAVDGSYTFSKTLLVRFELAATRKKTYATFAEGRIGPSFQSNQWNMLLGTDKTYRNSLYANVQWLVSYIDDMRALTPLQLHDVEHLTAFQLKKGFRSETLFIEFNGVSNLTTGEYVLTPQMTLQSGDYLKFVGGVHLNGRSAEGLGPIGQFDKNNTPYFETQVTF